MRLYKFFSALLSYQLLINVSIASNLNTDKSSESHFYSNTKDMEKGNSSQYNYIVKDFNFNKIHPIASLFNMKPSACYITSQKKTGSGNVIDFEKKGDIVESKISTAGHVVYNDNQFPTSEKIDKEKVLYPETYQGLISQNQKQLSFLAKYETNEVCFDSKRPRRDVAILKSNLTDSPLDYDELSKHKAIINKIKYGESIEGSMGHHPLGVFAQRINDGNINPDGSHKIPSLPSSSGAGIFDKDNQMSFIHNAGDRSLKDKVLYDISELKDYPIKEKVLYLGSFNHSVPFSKSDLEDFTECYRKYPH